MPVARWLTVGIAMMMFLLLSAPIGAEDIEIPSIPAPVPIDVDSGLTALLVMDMQNTNCPVRPACVASLPAVADLLDRARSAGMLIIQTTTGAGTVLPEVAALEGEQLLSFGADKFYRTDLADRLEASGVNSVVMVGTAANGAVLYTAFGAATRGYTVLVAEDGISSTTDFQTFFTRYQLLNQPGSPNPTNESGRAGAVTLTRTDLLGIRRAMEM
jgi:nicotinamidase-related amidase